MLNLPFLSSKATLCFTLLWQRLQTFSTIAYFIFVSPNFNLIIFVRLRLVITVQIHWQGCFPFSQLTKQVNVMCLFLVCGYNPSLSADIGFRFIPRWFSDSFNHWISLRRIFLDTLGVLGKVTLLEYVTQIPALEGLNLFVFSGSIRQASKQLSCLLEKDGFEI